MAESAAPQRPAEQETAHFRLHSLLDLRLATADVQRLPSLAQCTPVDLSLLATMVSELGSNILKYAGSGQMHVRTTPYLQRVDVEVVAEDRGPGIADIRQALQDNYSTSGTLGLGLSGVRRMSSQFHIDSAPGKGCRVRVHKWMARAPAVQAAPTALPRQRLPLPARQAMASAPLAQAPALPADVAREVREAPLRFDTATRVRPCRSELVSGDSTVVCTLPRGVLLACIDASGHGPRAHAVARTLAQRIQALAGRDLREILQRLHEAAIGTVGAAVALVQADSVRAELRMVGVGNIRVRCTGAASWTGVSRDGVLGERFSNPEEQTCSLRPDDVVILSSDGIREHVDRQTLARAHLGSAHMLAHQLMQQGARDTDDASCVVLLCKR